MYAVCSDCKKLADLQVCFDCKFTLCLACIKTHFEAWKLNVNKKCLDTEQRLACFNSHVDTFIDKPKKSLELLSIAESDIHEKFQSLVGLLTKEKDELLNLIAQLRLENSAYDEFKNRNKIICESLRQFREKTVE